jgi:hypothetical protein
MGGKNREIHDLVLFDSKILAIKNEEVSRAEMPPWALTESDSRLSAHPTLPSFSCVFLTFPLVNPFRQDSFNLFGLPLGTDETVSIPTDIRPFRSQ